LVPFNVLENTTFGKMLVAGITTWSRHYFMESTNSGHLAKANEVINACLPHANQSVRIGITGVPGVGKSTLLKLWNLFN
jgi:LAO/AO transport system kinase